MKFHAVLLYINDHFPDISIFRNLQEVGRGLYPKGAYLYSVEQEFISSITLLLPAEATKRIFQIIIQCLSSIGFTVYALNLFFLAVILRFMLNRQLWNT